MPKKLHKKLKARAKKLGLKGKQEDAYVYGTLNKIEKKGNDMNYRVRGFLTGYLHKSAAPGDDAKNPKALAHFLKKKPPLAQGQKPKGPAPCLSETNCPPPKPKLV